MKLADNYTIEVQREAQAIRQSILDVINAHPRSGFDVIRGAVPAHVQVKTVIGVVAGMIFMGELAATGPNRARRYVALTTTTRSAEQVLQGKRARNAKWHKNNAEAKRLEKQAERVRQAETAKADEPWRTTYREGDNPAIREFRSGGQGAVERPAIGSGMYGGVW